MAKGKETTEKSTNELCAIIIKLKDQIDKINNWLYSKFDILPQDITNILSVCDDLCSSAGFLEIPQRHSGTIENENTDDFQNLVPSNKKLNSDRKSVLDGSSLGNEQTDSYVEDFGIKNESLLGDNGDPLGGLSPSYSGIENYDDYDVKEESPDFVGTDEKFLRDQHFKKFNVTKTLTIVLHDINKCKTENQEYFVQQLRSSGSSGKSFLASPRNSNLTESPPTVSKPAITSNKRTKSSYKCAVCQKSYQTELSVQKHVIRDHDQSKKFHCHYKKCAKSFSSRSTFAVHMKFCHSDYYSTMTKGYRTGKKKKKNVVVQDGGKICRKCYKCFSTPEECRSHISKGCRLASAIPENSKQKTHIESDNLPTNDDPSIEETEEDNEANEDPGTEETEEDSEKNTFLCPKCNTGCLNLEFLNEHILKYCCKCKFCRRPFPSIHKRDGHSKHCSKKYQIREPTEPRKTVVGLSCELCQMNFTVLKDLEDHVIQHTVQAFYCTVVGCNKKRSSEEEINEHENKLHCQTCNKTFPHLSNFTVHNEKIHGGQAHFSQNTSDTKSTRISKTEFQCSKCKQLCTSLYTFKYHLERGCYECKLCGKVWPSRVGLEVHGKVHRQEKQFLCNICGKAFIKKGDLERHTSTQHVENRKTFKCVPCDKTYVTTLGYTRHMKMHDPEGVERVLCTLCGFDFSSSSSLKTHIRAVHDQLRPCACHLCDKKFKNTTSLKYHVKTHDNPNSRKRGLNKYVDDLVAVAKRRRKPASTPSIS